jgi:hypothetical protein
MDLADKWLAPLYRESWFPPALNFVVGAILPGSFCSRGGSERESRRFRARLLEQRRRFGFEAGSCVNGRGSPSLYLPVRLVLQMGGSGRCSRKHASESRSETIGYHRNTPPDTPVCRTNLTGKHREGLPRLSHDEPASKRNACAASHGPCRPSAAIPLGNTLIPPEFHRSRDYANQFSRTLVVTILT